ncbi:FMN-binding split barrel [Trema orientale]|uniref:FMN-binding split barrel n=1 Tax=Trema orientale TaxID=63057 RepID=A0A2P5EDL6_TREOI|nr:FMN-binding split barrel [Trema orientale]
MEALANSVFSPNFTEHYPLLNTPTSAIRTPNKRIGSLKISESSAFLRLRAQAAPSEASGSGETEDGKPLNNGFGLVSDDIVSLSHGDLSACESSEHRFNAAPNMNLSFTSQYGTGAAGGTRAGLFRTPISGGVQSATSAHGLPRPALAVRNLMEQARFAHLCTVMSRMHHRREGYPFGSLVDFAPDSTGHPIFSFSPLAIHTRNLLADPRCTLVVQIPGWSGLSNARVTVFGDVYPLPEDQQEWAHKQYIAKHQQGPSQQWGNFYYFRMQNISDIYFIGGFGTVAWVDVKEYEAIQPDKIAVDGGEQNLKELNAIFSKPLKELLSAESEVDDAALISIDSKGTDVRVRQGAQFNIQRISFDEGHSVETLEEAKAALWKLIKKGPVCNMHK